MQRYKTEYKTVDTSTLKGLKQAERLHMNGWITYNVGLFLVKFYRRIDVLRSFNIDDMDNIQSNKGE